MAILPRFLRPRGSADPATPNNESDLLINLATGLARERGRTRGSTRNLPTVTSVLTEIGRLSLTGGSSAPDRLPNRPAPTQRVLSPADFPFVFGGAEPSPAPRPAPRRRRVRRSRPSRPSRRSPPARRTPRVPLPEPPAAPQPDATPARRPPLKIPLPRVVPSIPGALGGLWRRLLDEYIKPRPRVNNPGGPRRGGERTRQPSPLPPLPSQPSPSPIPIPTPSPAPSSRPQGNVFDNPLPALGYDPFTYAWPAAPGRGIGTGVSPAPARSPAGSPLSLSSSPQSRSRPRDRRRARNPFPQSDPGTRRTTQPQRSPLTSLQPGQLELPQRESDPCAARARDAKRRQRKKRKECKEFVTKEIRVCRSSKEK